MGNTKLENVKPVEEMVFNFDSSKFELVKQDTAKGVSKYKYTVSDAFKTALKDAGLSKSVYDTVKNIEKAYLEQASSAMTDFGISKFKEDKDLKNILVSVPYGRGTGTVTAAMTKEITGTNSLTGQDYRTSGLTIKIKDGNIGKSYVTALKDRLTEQVLGSK